MFIIRAVNTIDDAVRVVYLFQIEVNTGERVALGGTYPRGVVFLFEWETLFGAVIRQLYQFIGAWLSERGIIKNVFDFNETICKI